MSNLVDTAALPSDTKNGWAPAKNTVSITPKNEVAQTQSRAKTNEYKARVHLQFSGRVKDLKKDHLADQMSHVESNRVFSASKGFSVHNLGEVSSSQVDEIDLSKVIITEMAVSNATSEFPYPVSFSWSGLENSGGKFTMRGKHSGLTLLPGQTKDARDVIFNVGDSLNDPIYKKFAHVTLNDLWSTIQIVNSAAGKIAYVPKDHQAIDIIRRNPRFGPAPTEKDSIHGNMYQVSPVVVGAAIDELYQKILSRFTFNDIRKFGATMTRVDEKNLDDLSGSKWDHLDEVDQKFNASQLLHAAFDLDITYTCPQSEAKVAVAPVAQTPVAAAVPPSNDFQSSTYSAFKLPVSAPKN